MAGISVKLLNVQKKLVVPKGKQNKFGGFNYRSVEDILAAVKPLCFEEGLLLTLSDGVEEKGGNYYIVSTAQITDVETDGMIFATGWARDPLEKKGMDAAQVTGTSSSYARKRALGGLFLIDDEVDVDSLDNRNEGSGKQVEDKKRKTYYQQLRLLCADKNIDADEFIKVANKKPLEATSTEWLGAAVQRFEGAYKVYLANKQAMSEEISV